MSRQITRPSGLVLIEITDRRVDWEYPSEILGTVLGRFEVSEFSGTEWTFRLARNSKLDLLDLMPGPLQDKIENLEHSLRTEENRRAPENLPETRRKRELDELFGH